MIHCLNQAARTYGTHCLAGALNLTPPEVYDRLEGFKPWTVRDAAALAIAMRRPLSELVIESKLSTADNLMH
ncbi:hypothetical protein [Arthrobacter sp. USHLN218]|uniref:hypothetical protein n=1 Tax=Arthrobacter sp. USHLN218 TaxID=3081232 RepID=UPI003015F475